MGYQSGSGGAAAKKVLTTGMSANASAVTVASWISP